MNIESFALKRNTREANPERAEFQNIEVEPAAGNCRDMSNSIGWAAFRTRPLGTLGRGRSQGGPPSPCYGDVSAIAKPR